MNWDDVRLFLTVARTGNSRAAARELAVNQSTVSRRIKQLERSAGVQLFERRPAGLRLTESGHEMVASAQRIEEEFARIGRHVLGRDVRLTGRVRITLPDLMVAGVAPILARFGERYPAIALELNVENGYVSLTHREADVALRLGTSAPEHLVGRRIASAPCAIYAAPAYLERWPDGFNLRELDWIGWEEPWRETPIERWLSANIPPARVRARVNTNFTQKELIAAGLGAGFQVCYNGDADPRLRRISEAFDFGLSLWLLTHEDLRHTARIGALMSFVADALMEQRSSMEAA